MTLDTMTDTTPAIGGRPCRPSWTVCPVSVIVCRPSSVTVRLSVDSRLSVDRARNHPPYIVYRRTTMTPDNLCTNVLTHEDEHTFECALMGTRFSGGFSNGTPNFRVVLRTGPSVDKEIQETPLTTLDRMTTVRYMETTGSDTTEDRMTGTDAIDYLGLQNDCRKWAQRDADLHIIEFAEDRGFYAGVWDGVIVEYGQAQASGLEGYDDYDGDLDTDLHRIAIDAVEYLTDEGLLPDGYGQRPEHVGDGYGLLPDDGEGS